MTRRPFVAGNWKLNKTVGESLELVRELSRLVASVRKCDIAVAPPYTALHPVAKQLSGSNVEVAAQEIYFESDGAFTGTVSAAMVKEAGCRYTLVGHSERRQLFGETLQSSHRRMNATLEAGLSPILCVGETLAEREGGKTQDIVVAQLTAAMAGFSVESLKDLVIAYEPVWAIGTGVVASPAQAQEVHAFIREWLRAKDSAWADAVRLQYGGSVKAENAEGLLSQPDIDGALVGGASLKADGFAAIVKAAADSV